jgi:hypothetical protein
MRVASIDTIPPGWGDWTATWTYNGNEYKNWKPRDSFSWLSDGTSNTILFGEKHIPSSRLEICEGYNGVSMPGGGGAVWDCGIMFGFDNWREPAAAKHPSTDGWHETIVGNPSKYANNNTDSYSFGSAHPGICNFMLGDGAVRTLSASTLPLLVCRLIDARDGNPVSLP